MRAQSNNITLNAADPDFTQCFEFTAVRLLPCVYWLVLVAPDYALYLAGRRGGVGWRRTSALNVAKLVRLPRATVARASSRACAQCTTVRTRILTRAHVCVSDISALISEYSST